MAENSLSQVLRATSISGGAALLTSIVGIAKWKAVALLLGPVGVGLYGNYLSLVATAAALAGFGLGTSGARELASANEERSAAIARRAIVAGNIVLGVLGLAVVLALRRWISKLIFGTEAHSDDIGVLAIALFFSLLANAQIAILQGSRRIGQMAIANVIGAVAGAAVGVALIAIFGVRGIAWFVLLGPAATAFAGYSFCSRIQTRASAISWAEIWLRWRTMLQVGFAIMWSALIGQFSQLVVRGLLTREIPDGLVAAGYFQAAWTLSMGYLGFVLSAMTADYFPRLTAVVANRELLFRAVNEQTEVALLLTTPALLITIAFSGLLLTLFFDSSFSGAAELLRLQTLGDVLKVASWPVAFIILAKGDARIYVVTETIAHATYLVVSVVLLPILEVRAAGVGFVAMYLTYFVVVSYIARRRYKFVWAPMVLFKLLICFAAVAATFLAAWFSESVSRVFGSIATIAFLIYTAFWMRSRDSLPGSLARLLRRKKD